MTKKDLLATGSAIVGPMIQLARCAKTHRIIVAGAKSAELMFEPHRRGYVRVANTATCGLSRGQFDVALVDWRLRSIKALDTLLNWLVHFLAASTVLVIWLDFSERPGNRKLGSMLDRLGFAIEAGTLCEHGFAVAARRWDAAPMRAAA